MQLRDSVPQSTTKNAQQDRWLGGPVPIARHLQGILSHRIAQDASEMAGDSASIRLREITHPLGMLGLNSGDLDATHDGGRGKSCPVQVGNDDVVIPPAILRT